MRLEKASLAIALAAMTTACGGLYKEELVRRDHDPNWKRRHPPTSADSQSNLTATNDPSRANDGADSGNPTAGATTPDASSPPPAPPTVGEDATACSDAWRLDLSNDQVNLHSNFKGVPFSLKATASLTAENGKRFTLFNIGARLLSTSPPIPGFFTKPFVASLVGLVKVDYLDDTQKPNDGPWASIDCAVRPVNRITFKTTQVQLSKPIPFLIYPRDMETLDAEIGDQKDFPGVKANVAGKAPVDLDVKIRRLGVAGDRVHYLVQFLPNDKTKEMAGLGLPMMSMGYVLDTKLQRYVRMDVHAILNKDDKIVSPIAMDAKYEPASGT